VESERYDTVTFDDDSSSNVCSSDASSNGDTSSATDSSESVCSADPSSDGSTDGASSDSATSNDESASDGGTSSSSSSQAVIGGWSDAVASGWNSGARVQGTVQRIPLQGLSSLNQDPAPNPATTESAAGRAILCVPSTLDASQPVEVLLHLHGHNIGLRQRVASSLPDAGTVHDVLMDQIEDQLGSSGRPMIALLPQGTLSSGFSNGTSAFDCDGFINEALGAAVTAGVWSSAPEISRVLLSAHSGGGGSVAVMAAQAGQPHFPSKICALFLFEAINGPNELSSDTAYITAKLNADLANLNAASDKLQYLKSSFRLRGVYNPQDDSPSANYAALYPALRQSIAAWFGRNAPAIGGVGSDTYNAFVANYQIVQPSPYVQHDGIVGGGNLAQALAMLT
jgi:hypothetical protein